jgi:tetratricopeptide (TPR) repeat protein
LTFRIRSIVGHSQVADPEEGFSEAELIRVQCARLDDIVREANVGEVRLLKVDVEGHEIAVFSGAESLLSAGTMDVVLVEKNLYLLEELGFHAGHLVAMLARHNYIVAYPDGRQVTRDNISLCKCENLLFFRNETIAAEIGFSATHATQPFSEAEIEAFYWEALHQDVSVIAANRLIRLARGGRLSEAIEKGEVLLKTNPGLHKFRGHIAHWHHALGNYQCAIRHYEEIIHAVPEDAEAMKLLENVKAEAAFAQ